MSSPTQIMNNLYPVMVLCDGNCKKQYSPDKMIRQWHETPIKKHYCMPCWGKKNENI